MLHVLIPEIEIKPDEVNRTYFPTTKYELPLFFISVKTNVGYSIVADFVVQEETIEQISEALWVLQSWNPDWKPPYFMTDYVLRCRNRCY